MDNNISFSKIVATPTLNSWSQAYNAGKLFAVLSLQKEKNTALLKTKKKEVTRILTFLNNPQKLVEDKK